MSRRISALLFLTSLAVIFAFAGCSDEAAGPGINDGDADTTNLLMIDVADIVRSVTPPVYSAPQGAIARDSFEVWTQGDYPLLESVFGDEQVQTLERNVFEFEFFTGMFMDVLLVDENGDIITGTYIDSVTRLEQEQEMVYHGTFEVSALTGATTIPAAVQAVLGTSYNMDYLVEITIDEIPGGEVKVGFKLDSTEQAMIVYLSNMDDDTASTGSSLVYSSLDPRDSTFVFKGVLHGSDNYGTYSVAYIISSEISGEFGYRASWVYDDIGSDWEPSLGCIIGGGNKDVEFALKFRQFDPADAQTADTLWSFEEVFGPNYSNSAGLISSYSSYVDEALIIRYDKMPLTTILNPWATQ